MDNIKYKYVRLLTEGYNFSNADETISAIKANQVGVKINNSFKIAAQKCPNALKSILRYFFERCQQLGVKETTYGVQLLLSKTDCYSNDDDDDGDEDCSPNSSLLADVVNTDGFYEVLKSYKKPWVKEMTAFQSLMERSSWNFTSIDTLHELEKDIQREQRNHGKKSKGSGEIQDVKNLYDDGTWKLMSPTSFDGAKAASFYIKNGEETPTEWCTRCDEYYYNKYSKRAPLYIIRNMKTGKSYQLAFEWETTDDEKDDYITVWFLDQNDENGDEVTGGDLSKIPTELLKKIPIPVGKMKGKTMADYKATPAVDPHEGESGYTKKGETTFGKPQEIDSKTLNAALGRLKNQLSEKYYNELLEKIKGKKVYKSISKKATDKEYPENYESGLSSYVRDGKIEKHIYEKKAGAKRYYLEGDPEHYYQVKYSKKAHNSEGKVENKVGDTLLDELFQAIKGVEEKTIPLKASGVYRGNPDQTVYYRKDRVKDYLENKKTGEKLNEIHTTVQKQFAAEMKAKNIRGFQIPEESPEQLRLKGNGYNGMAGRTVRLIIGDRVGNETEFIIEKGYPFNRKNVRWLPNTAFEYNEEREEYSEYNKEEYKDIAWKIMSAYNRLWRQKFQSDIIQNRVNKEYRENMYEGVNYFPY